MTDVTLVTGDGIGPEIADTVRRCIDATGVDINWNIAEARTDVMERLGIPLPDATVEMIKKPASH
jgi:isocitrate dehydrogenase (NAD+)